MHKRIIISVFILVLLAITLFCSSDLLYRKTQEVYDYHHKSKIVLEDHIKYSTIRTVELESDKWSELKDTYVALILISIWLKRISLALLLIAFMLPIIYFIKYKYKKAKNKN